MKKPEAQEAQEAVFAEARRTEQARQAAIVWTPELDEAILASEAAASAHDRRVKKSGYEPCPVAAAAYQTMTALATAAGVDPEGTDCMRRARELKA